VQSEDQYMERTPDLVAKVRQLREAAGKAMNRFTSVADYDVRRVVGQKPETAPVSADVESGSSSRKRSPKAPADSSTAARQAVIEFSLAPSMTGEDKEDE
jgi:hypothetical protein